MWITCIISLPLLIIGTLSSYLFWIAKILTFQPAFSRWQIHQTLTKILENVYIYIHIQLYLCIKIKIKLNLIFTHQIHNFDNIAGWPVPQNYSNALMWYFSDHWAWLLNAEQHIYFWVCNSTWYYNLS